MSLCHSRNRGFGLEEDLSASIKTPAVLDAFEGAEINKLPADVRAAYEAQDSASDWYSQHTEEQFFNARMVVYNLFKRRWTTGLPQHLRSRASDGGVDYAVAFIICKVNHE